MKIKVSPTLNLRVKTKTVLIAASAGIVSIVLFMFFFGYFNAGIQHEANATTTESIPTGSYIINCGTTPQTNANGLLPYGMIYELTTTYNVPIKWILSPTKTKDWADFVHNGVSYRSGAFIIPAPFIDSTIAARITHWNSLGVIGAYSVSSMSLPVYSEIKNFPLVMIDTLSLNDPIIENYYANAGIPSTAYTKGSPDQVNACHDLWANPHGDPAWSTHNYLYDFVTTQKSYIWMQCHAVSMMESCANPSAPFTQLNYLTTNGLQCYQSNKCQVVSEYHNKAFPGAATNYLPADPVAQFMGELSGACSGGSERWFIPPTTGGWRTTTKIITSIGTSVAPRQGVLIAYGPAYGDTTNGLVMYTGGHDISDGALGHTVAAQRTFFNFLLLAGKAKAPQLSATITGSIYSNSYDTLSVSVTSGTGPYTFNWSSSLGGTFSNKYDSITQFGSPYTAVPIETIITCVVTDACGRKTFISQPLTINATPLPITLVSFTAKLHNETNALLNWVTATEKNNDYFSIYKSKDGTNFTHFEDVKSKGSSNNIQYYSLLDHKPFQRVTYYKLAQTDFNGASVDIDIVKVQGNRTNKSDIISWPNPFIDHITLSIPSGYEPTVTIVIFDMLGKVVHTKNVSIGEEQTEIHITSLESIVPGNYVLKVYRGSSVSTGLKILKK